MRFYFKLYNLAIIIYLITFCWAQNLSFKDIAAQGSLNFIHDHGGSGEYYYVESMGSGVCIFDYDNDGLSELDEFVADTIPLSLDIDGDLRYDALTDGLLVLRGMFGLDGTSLVTGTVSADAQFVSPEEIIQRTNRLNLLLDVDGNEQIDALTDGLLVLRYLFGLSGDTLTAGVVASDAIRSTEEILNHLSDIQPAIVTD